MELTEQEILQDSLIAEKFLINMYCQFGLECSNPELRSLFTELYNVALDHDFKIFKIMNEKNFYPTTPATMANVKQAIKLHSQMQKELEQKIKSN